uniref:Uncharacterized protein n=1 Tax=Leptobrachium leishanense TaxID=445787 RepID=A0A8C5PHH9_9ANUR
MRLHISTTQFIVKRHLTRESRATAIMSCLRGSPCCFPITVRISSISDSTNFFASSLSEAIRLLMITIPLCWTCKSSFRQSLCSSSNH